MPLSLYQVPLRQEYFQAEFHPINHSLFLLDGSGQLDCISLSGEPLDRFFFSRKPFAFHITSDGSLVYILCEGVLITYNVISKRHTESRIDDTLHFFECFKNCAVLYNLGKQALIMKPHGRKEKSLHFDFYIRQIKVVQKTKNLLIYNENRDFIYMDMEGKMDWMIEKVYVASDILVSDDGRNSYFFDNSNHLIKCNLQDQSFVVLDGIPPCKFMTMPSNGSLLLLFDFQNNVRLFDEKEMNIWNYHFDHVIRHIKMAPRGNYFATIDEDGILTCFSTYSSNDQPNDFLEFSAQKRILNKTTNWSIKTDVALQSLKVNAAGRHAGMVCRNGSIRFTDEQGQIHFQTTFPDPVSFLSFDDFLNWCYISDKKQAMLSDIANAQSTYFQFEPLDIHKSIVNYAQQRIYLLSKRKDLYAYDFKGNSVDIRSSMKEPLDMLSCATLGTALFNRNALTILSPAGQSVFDYHFKKEILQLFYRDDHILGFLSDGSLFSFELHSLKGRCRTMDISSPETQILCIKPLLFDDGKGNLYHLALDLETIARRPIKSSSSLFFYDNAIFQEIMKIRDGFFGYDHNQKLSWRYHSEKPVMGSALMEHGLIFFTSHSVDYIRLSGLHVPESPISDYVEI